MRHTRCPHGQPVAFECDICDATPNFYVTLLGSEYSVVTAPEDDSDDAMWGWALFNEGGALLAESWATCSGQRSAVRRAVEIALEIQLNDVFGETR